jgi:Gpi18-like mannosyltransferase
LLGGMLLLAFLLRLAFIGAAGYTGDVSTFEAWSLQLGQHPVSDFYSSTGFADYPPGYFVVLWGVGRLYTLFVHSDPGFEVLKHFVKMPAIVMDLVCITLIFVIAKRFGSLKWAFVAAALFAFNPATIMISAMWGQVDSVSAAFVLGALLMLTAARDRTDRRGLWLTIGAWLALSYSILIKPHALILVPLFLAVPFVGAPLTRAKHLAWTGAAIVSSFALAALVALPFHPTANPIDLFGWLYNRYAYGSGVYAYNSINAFNLHTIFNGFWKADSDMQPSWKFGSLALGLPQYVWGILLVAGATALIVWRFVQVRSAQALLEAACLLCFAYFILSTRMHERYVFNAFVLTMPLAALSRRYLYAALVLTLTLIANLQYSLYYLFVMNNKVAVNAGDLWPGVTHLLSAVNALTMFLLLFAYLGTRGEEVDDRRFRELTAGIGRAAREARGWFSPLEGAASMRPIDYGIAAALTVAAFVLSVVNYAVPGEKVFDEIYYARAGEEYLRNQNIFEFTHPPLTKLIVTLSMMLFGGLHGLGDTASGWRFLQVVLGALMVWVIYVFAKRLLGSTAFAAAAAAMLTLDGFHFVQSRIATPEMGVAFFSLTTAYAFYRFWLARQVRIAPALTPRLLRIEAVLTAAAAVLAIAPAYALAHFQLRPEQPADQVWHAGIVVWVYVMSGLYALIRVFAPRFAPAEPSVSYADGSHRRGGVLFTPDGGALGAKKVTPGDRTEVSEGGLTLKDAPLEIAYGRDGTASYRTPAGDALFSPDGRMTTASGEIGAGDGRLWFWLLALSAGLLGASKWNGLFTIFTVWLLACMVVLQSYAPALARGIDVHLEKRPAFWGNPRGFSWDVLLAGMLFVGISIYALTYTPYFFLAQDSPQAMRGHNVVDVVELQHGMYAYHHNLVATHPYASDWWEWPIIKRPVSYYYKDSRSSRDSSDWDKCCIREIMALPNPVVWWFGLVTVPWIGWLAWKERNKGFALLFALYLIQWLPWIATPRLAFEYHFFPNLAIIVLANTAILQRLWNKASTFNPYRLGVVVYGCAVVVSFIYFYPLVAGTPLTYQGWHDRITTLPSLVLFDDRAWI